MKKIAFLIALLGSFVYASEAVSQGTDIVARTINFLIFAAILWYLVAGKAKAFFENRRNEIASKFQEVENKLKEAKEEKEALLAKLEESKKLAQEIVEDAKKETEIIYNNIVNATKEEIAILEKHFEEAKKYEVQKAKKEAVKAFLEDLLKDIHISSEDAAKIALKVV